MHQLFQLDIFAQTYSVQLRYIGDGIILYNGIHSFPKLVHQETIDGTLRDQLDNRVNYEHLHLPVTVRCDSLPAMVYKTYWVTDVH